MTQISFKGTASRVIQALTVGIILALSPAQATAQGDQVDPGAGDQPATPGLTSRLDWRADYEDNVFRSATRPVSDLVSTLGANIAFRGQLRRAGLTASAATDWVHFARLINERGANAGGALKLDLQFNRILPYVSTSYYNSRQRRNLEVDTRPRIEQSTVAVGAIVRVGGKTALDFSAQRARQVYDRRATVDGVSLSDALNRVADYFTLSLRQEVTPLTRFTVTGEARRDQFDASPYRNADYLRLTTGFESAGRLNGRADVGLRILKPHDPSLSESRGFYMSVATNATVLDRVQIRLDAERDIAPSYRSHIAYYEYYSYGASLTCALGRSLRLSAMVGQRRADYRNTGGAVSFSADATGVDHETRYGSDVSYRIGDSMAIDFSGAYTERRSSEALRRFDGMSLTAGVRHVF